MAGQSPLEDPLSHSLDGDLFHFPADKSWDVFEATRGVGKLFGWAGIDGLSKFMFLEVIAAGLLLVILIPFALRLRMVQYIRGVFGNALESVLLFIRDQVAIPAIGDHDAHEHLPFLWSMFFFILFNNLLGMIPWMGSPTGALGTTVALALCSFAYVHLAGIRKMGLGHYAAAFVPHVEWWLYPLMLLIEIVGHLIRPTILAVRLFVNMLAGHTVLYVIVGFIFVIYHAMAILYPIVAPASIVGSVLLSVMELFVAFLQAYVFTFLTAIFIGGAVHPQH